MAIQKSITCDRYGIPCPDAYIKIDGFGGDKNRIGLNVSIFYNQQARIDEKTPISVLSYEVPYADQTLSDLYDYLKTLPEFAGATDLLE
jgi:hypothetical protein